MRWIRGLILGLVQPYSITPVRGYSAILMLLQAMEELFEWLPCVFQVTRSERRGEQNGEG